MFLRRRWTLTLLAALMLAAGRAAAVHAQSSRPTVRVVVVQAGDSLWGLSARYAPQQDPRRWIYEVERLNGLRSGTIEAGQELRIPG